MRPIKYQATILVAATLLLISLSLASATQNQGNIENVDSNTLPSARAQFQLPKIFDFNKFTSLFNKRYNSVIEALVRKKIYLARAFSAFVSVVSYKHEKSTSYLSINSRSDRTPEELKRLKISADKLRIFSTEEGRQPENQEQADPNEEPTREAAIEPLPVANLDDIERELDGLSELKGDPEAEAILEELKANRRTRRNAEKRHQLSADQLLHSPDAVDLSDKIQSQVPSNNPSYLPVDLSSQANADDGNEQEEQAMDISSMDAFIKARARPFLKSIVGWAREKFHVSAGDKSLGLKIEEPKQVELSGSDRVFVDHRRSRCFFEPRNQGNCGACYAFAAIALSEYLFCRDTGKHVVFSEQYMVDCGSQFHSSMDGCDGAGIIKTLQFIDEYGLQLLDKYPYRAEEGICPYDRDVPAKSMGYIRVKNKGYELVRRVQIDERLQESPLLATLFLNDQFDFYGGGVDELRECYNDDAHAMLMVGHGLEDGLEYYLLRNSFAVDWGERGYYKVSKMSFKRCLADYLALKSKVTFSKKAAHSIKQ